MNLLISAPMNHAWINASKLLSAQGFDIKYWVGDEVDSEKADIGEIFFHNAWDAFYLKNKCLKSERFNVESASLYKKISRVEYYNYLKILDRVDYKGFFTFSERDLLFKEQLCYWQKVLENYKIDFVVFSNAPHLPYDYPLYLVLKEKEIPCFIFNRTSLKNRFYITFALDGSPIKLPECFINSEKEFYQEAFVPFCFNDHVMPWYMENQIRFDRSFFNFFRGFYIVNFGACLVRYLFDLLKGERCGFRFNDKKINSLKLGLGKYGSKQANIFSAAKYKQESFLIKKRLKRNYKSVSMKVDMKSLGDFLYLPLHYQPELTTTPYGADASDQIFLIKEILKCLPEGMKLVIKEHSSQFSNLLYGEQGRYFGYWDDISKSDKLILASLDTSSIELMKSCKGVITVTGTSGWEAFVNNIPCLVVGEAWYKEYKNVVNGNIYEIKDLISKMLRDRVKQDDYCFSRCSFKLNNSIDGQYSSVSDGEVLAKVILSLQKNEIAGERCVQGI